MEIKFDLKLIYPNPDKWDDHYRVQHSRYFLWAVQGAFNDITPNVEWVEQGDNKHSSPPLVADHPCCWGRQDNTPVNFTDIVLTVYML